MKKDHMQNRRFLSPVAANYDKVAFVTALCAAGGVASAEDENGGGDDVGLLPAEIVDGADVNPQPRPVPRPAPEPEVVEIEEDEPLVLDDDMYRVQKLANSRYTQPLLDVPQTVQVITEDLIQDQGATSLREALRNVSGISLQAGEGGAPPGDSLSIRGFSARTDFYIDGIRDFGAYTRDPFNLEQIEVAKGPASANSGRGSTGGSINLVSKSARPDDFVRSDVSVGSDQLLRGTLDINQRIPDMEGAAFRLNVMGHQDGVSGRDITEDHRWGIAGGFGFGIGEDYLSGPSDTRVYVDFFHLEEDNTPDYGIPWVPSNVADPDLVPYIDKAPPVPFNNFYGLANRDFEETSTSTGTLRFEHDFNDNVTFSNKTRVGQTERLSLVTPPRFVTGSDPAMIRRSDWKDRDEINTIYANVSDLYVSFETGTVQHDALVGFEYVHEEYDRYRRETEDGPDTDLFSPTPFDAFSAPYVRTGQASYSEADTTAVYFFDTIEFNDWLQFTGGVRHEHFDIGFLNVDGMGGSELLGRTDKLTSGRAAVVVKPKENGSVYFGWGTSFNPSGEGLTLSSGGRRGATFQVDPEKTETFELGTKWNVLDNRLSLSGALFQIDKTNARTSDPADPDNVIVLEGEQRVHGFELGAAGAINEWWNIYANFTHLDSKVVTSLDPDDVGHELPNTPQNSFSLWTQAELPCGLILGGGPVFVDSRFNNVSNVREAPSYCIWDAMVGYEVNEHLTLRVNFRNLEDERYIDRMSGGHFIPGDGRSVQFTASMDF